MVNHPQGQGSRKEQTVNVFKVRIECEGAAFDGVSALEVGRILRDLAADIAREASELMGGGGSLRDINGNRCGSWSFTEEEAAK